MTAISSCYAFFMDNFFDFDPNISLHYKLIANCRLLFKIAGAANFTIKATV